MENNTQVIVQPTNTPANPTISAETLLAQAIEKNYPVEGLERLLLMAEKAKAIYAKEQYVLAMAKFQAECPVIKKKKIVKEKNSEKTRYKYAPLDEIVQQTKELISKNGFSYRFDEEKDDKYATAICIVTHTAGHSEQSSFKIEIGSEEYMSSVQKYGARMTFAKRYAFCDAFGIITGDEDNDAQVKDEVKPADVSEYKAKLSACKNAEELKKAWGNLPAKAKGDLFTFKEELKKKYENA